MSFLTPLYALGALAIAAPIVFHLIRRTPSGEVPFSSLMFLDPSPPRLSKRSRLDQIVLLLLRAAVLGLLAFAFARPFLRASALVDAGDGASDRQRVALLIDASASMRRGNLWARARSIAAETIAGIRPTDQLAVFTFDSASRTVLGFDESTTLDPQRRQAIARQRLDALQLTWASTQLGQALIDVVTAINDVADASEKAGRMPRRVVLVGDMQQGSRIDALGEFEWPSDVVLDLKSIADEGANAGLHGLAESPGVEHEPGAEESVRVRVSNDAGSRDTFSLAWAGDDGIPLKSEPPTPAYIPPGESRVIRVLRPKGSQAKPPTSTLPAKRPTRLVLTGDQRDFDNMLYLAEKAREEATVLFLGGEADRKADDPKGLLYYVRRAFVDTSQRSIKVVAQAAGSPLSWDVAQPPTLVILAAETSPDNAAKLRAYAESGGAVLGVLIGPGKAGSLATVAGVTPSEIAEAKVGRDAILGEISFDHPLFAPFAAPQFNDFTKVHFWKYRRLDPKGLGENVRVLAKFERGDPAVVEKPIGKGRLVVFTSGWNPADSQLARSSKFVPLMMSLAEGRDRGPLVEGTVLVGDRVPLPKASSKPTGVRKPDGSRVTLRAAETVFSGTDQPGIYVLETSSGERPFAVNLDPLESRVAPLNVETLEQLGCRLAKPADARAEVDPERQRQLQNAELEGRQKLWRWLVLAAIAFLIAETWFSGRLSRPRTTTRIDSQPAPAEALAS